MKINNSKILVIGGAGFIGSHVVSELLKTKVKEVVVYDNFTRGKKSNLAENLKDSCCTIYPNGGDVRDVDAMKGKDGVVHLAPV